MGNTTTTRTRKLSPKRTLTSEPFTQTGRWFSDRLSLCLWSLYNSILPAFYYLPPYPLSPSPLSPSSLPFPPTQPPRRPTLLPPRSLRLLRHAQSASSPRRARCQSQRLPRPKTTQPRARHRVRFLARSDAPYVWSGRRCRCCELVRVGVGVEAGRGGKCECELCFSFLLCRRLSPCWSRADDAVFSRYLVQRETTLMPYLRALSAFRDEVRKLAISKADPKEILALSDRLRDYQLAELGVALDDQEGTPPHLPLFLPSSVLWPLSKPKS
jgi:hypothetical protein